MDMTGVYVGKELALAGKSALIQLSDEGWVKAQFNDRFLQVDGVWVGYFWWSFPAIDFDITTARDRLRTEVSDLNKLYAGVLKEFAEQVRIVPLTGGRDGGVGHIH